MNFKNVLATSSEDEPDQDGEDENKIEELKTKMVEKSNKKKKNKKKEKEKKSDDESDVCDEDEKDIRKYRNLLLGNDEDGDSKNLRDFEITWDDGVNDGFNELMHKCKL